MARGVYEATALPFAKALPDWQSTSQALGDDDDAQPFDPVLFSLSGGGRAQTPAPYRPGLGDLMTMTVQPRHLKLGLAGQAKNWPYVVYEGHELEEAFERVAKQVPKWREFDIAS